jgi:hypothetical protein
MESGWDGPRMPPQAAEPDDEEERKRQRAAAKKKRDVSRTIIAGSCIAFFQQRQQ